MSVEDNVISGSELKTMLHEHLEQKVDEEEDRGMTWAFKNPAAMDYFKKDILQVYVVVYRADPEVKHMLTAAIRESGSVVGVTGEGLNDARALSDANLGFAMGQDGCAAAKEHADIILTDDNFASVVNAIRWGRNMQDNTRKFIQYQMTVNISCLTFVIFSIVTLGFSPFSVFQLLWINLVMDVLAAIAFATEHPHPTNLRKERIKKKDSIITPLMVRATLSQALYQFLVMVVLLFFGPAMFGIRYDFYPLAPLTVEVEGVDEPTRRLQHQTLLFQTFMMLNFFNMLNCRVLGQKPPAGLDLENNDPLSPQEAEALKARRELNIFTRIFDNWWFLIILLFELNFQYLMVQYPAFSNIFITTPLTLNMHITTLCLGLGSWLVMVGVKFTPEKFLKKMPVMGEDEKTLEATQDAIKKGAAYAELE